MQVYTGSSLFVSRVLCFYIMGWTGTCNMLMFHSSFKLSLVFHILIHLSLICQGTYLTSTARSYAADNNLHEDAIIGDFNGEFWALFALHQVIKLYFHSRHCFLFL